MLFDTKCFIIPCYEALKKILASIWLKSIIAECLFSLLVEIYIKCMKNLPAGSDLCFKHNEMLLIFLMQTTFNRCECLERNYIALHAQ